ncbi:hypothetical protein SAMN04488510_10457 [Fervidobacterium changbaicum]|uniref:hypothetical protein n=1 Tax=Fervidobacterium changbaicum TaxID=310769 RepID=UPI00089013D5|nr:hypothetical protein [Fervidobacterium changbaicum]SDH07460.1 hypothetical protein SAMN04488510_10457 [Fervidobacterium changbaicum]
MVNENFLTAIRVGITGYLSLIAVLILFYFLIISFVNFFAESDKNGSKKGNKRAEE